jgi:hypothetical protein
MDRKVKDTNGATSILPAIQCWNVLYDRSSTTAIKRRHTTIKHKTVGSVLHAALEQGSVAIPRDLSMDSSVPVPDLRSEEHSDQHW